MDWINYLEGPRCPNKGAMDVGNFLLPQMLAVLVIGSPDPGRSFAEWVQTPEMESHPEKRPYDGKVWHCIVLYCIVNCRLFNVILQPTYTCILQIESSRLDIIPSFRSEFLPDSCLCYSDIRDIFMIPLKWKPKGLIVSEFLCLRYPNGKRDTNQTR